MSGERHKVTLSIYKMNICGEGYGYIPRLKVFITLSPLPADFPVRSITLPWS